MSATSFFGGAFFGGEFFNTPAAVSTGQTPAGKASKKRRKVIIGDRLYEVDSLKDVEFLLKRVVREDAEPIKVAAKGRVRVVDTLTTKLDVQEPVALPMQAMVDWSALWNQLAIQDREYALILERVLMRQEEDDIETILLLN